jgi:hypothetical protein
MVPSQSFHSNAGAQDRAIVLPPWGVQVCQVVALLVIAPLISGVIAKAEAGPGGR